MAQITAPRRILSLFADILEYPQDKIAEVVHECETLLQMENTGAAALLAKFRRFAEEKPLGRLEEEYTKSFDMYSDCYPYVGYHLLGESYKRSVLLLGLKERYKAQSFTTEGKEPPDHISVMLRFLAASGDLALNQELIHEAVLPALEKMVGEETGHQRPNGTRKKAHYKYVLKALQLTLRQHLSSAELQKQEGSNKGGNGNA